MQLKKFAIVLWAVLGRTCFARIAAEIPDQNDVRSRLVNATVNVLISCYGELISSVGLYGDTTGILFRILLSRQSISVITMDSSSKDMDNSHAWNTPWYKLQSFIVIASSSTELRKILKEIKISPWWNHMATFLVFNWAANSNDQCLNAFEFLWAAWEINILNVKFICVHRTKGVLLYVYNPFAKKASASWKLKNTFRAKDNQTWFMFVQRYREDAMICEDLEFDQTRDLGGYAIPSSVQDMNVYWYTNLNKTGIDSFEGLEGLLLKFIFHAMNANTKLLAYSKDDDFLITIKNGTTVGVIRDVISGTSDIILNSWYQEILENMTTTYPYWNTGLGVLTGHSSRVSQLSKINSVLDVTSRYCLYLVMLITPICFKYFLHHDTMRAILSTVCIICNAGLSRITKKASTRIYLTSLLFFQVTILAIYQGKLASLLTKPIYLKNIDTLQDLIDSSSTIYGHTSLAHWFSDPMFNNRYVSIGIFNCTEYILRDLSAACMFDWDIRTSEVIPSVLYMSRDKITKTSLVYIVREDWPLEQRFNEVIARLIEADIVRRVYRTYSEKLSSINEFNEKMRNNESFEVISLGDLSFAFALLGIGLGCATIIFIFETGIYRI